MTVRSFSHPALQDFFGTTLTPFGSDELARLIAEHRQAGDAALLVGCHNLHSLYLGHRDATMAAFFRRCAYCYVDGVPVLWLLRGLGLDDGARRFSLMDTLPDLLDRAEREGWRVCYLGNTPAVIERAERWISGRWPALAATLVDGYQQDRAAYEAVAAARPDLLFVGMGMPRQESWILDHVDRLPPCVILQAGATLDYYTGAQAKPPAWLSRLGLGGVYRLLHDPRRLWRRYLLEPWALAGPFLRLRRELRRPEAEHRDRNPR